MSRATLAALCFAACATAALAETRTVTWFIAHPSERMQLIRSCRNDPGTARHIPECENAEAAEWAAYTRNYGQRPDTLRTLINDCATMGKQFQRLHGC